MHDGVRILDMAIYHPDKVVTNEPYIEHFKNLGIEDTDLLVNVFGRDKRFLIDNTGKKDEARENSLTMQIEVAKKVLKKCNLTGMDMDGLILATQVPEYFVPSNSLLLHKELNIKTDSFCYDLNSNCTSMIVALEQAYHYFAFNQRVKYLLVVGGDYQSFTPKNTERTMYGAFGDAACAFVLKRTTSNSGFVDNDYFVNHNYTYGARFPGNGLSKIPEGGNFQGIEGPAEVDLPIVADKIRIMLKRNNLKIEDIKGFCFSQYTIRNIKILQETLHIPDECCPYIGDIYGYTGVSSPFIALYSLVEHEKVKENDYILFWSIGTGTEHYFELIRY